MKSSILHPTSNLFSLAKPVTALVLMTVLSANSLMADTVYVTARPSPSGAGANPNGTYTEVSGAGSDTSAVGTAPGVPARSGCRFFSNSFSNTSYALSFPNPGFRLTPTLGIPGAVYQIHHNFSSTAGNVSTNISLTVTCSIGGTLSFTTSSTNFISASGSPATQWKLLGYLTNDIASTTPTIDFYYLDGNVNAGLNNRLLVDTFRFTFYEACLDIPVVGITGPLSTNVNAVVVTGVSASATNVFLYQDSGAGMVLIGNKTNGVTAGNNTVTNIFSPLVRNAQVSATQKINGQEGCTPTAGTLVGGGANPSVRIALTIRETSSTGPAGDPGSTASANLHFLGATAVSGGSPINATVVNAANGWQTVTFLRGTNEVVGDSANVAGSPISAVGYAANDSVSIQVYAYRTLPNGVTIYSATSATSSEVTSNDVFTVNWTWDAVAGAQGYRVLRQLNFGGYNEYQDIALNSLSDANSGWTPGATVTPITSQPGRSVQWNPSVSNTNNLPGQWGILESVCFAINNLDDTGPFDLYMDNFQNGATLIQTFEKAPAKTTDYGFRQPSFSGTTSGNLMTTPNVGQVANEAADTGTKSFRVSFQWSGTNATRWLRLTTSAVNNPQVNLNEPISFRLLLQPANVALPTPPTAPALTNNLLGSKVVVTWPGGHRLQTSVDVSGTYTNVPQVLSANTWTNVTMGAFLAPWTNTFAETNRFFRLLD